MTRDERGEDWRLHLIDDEDSISRLIAEHASYCGARYQGRARSSSSTTCPNTPMRAGFEIVPVPVYYPDVTA